MSTLTLDVEQTIVTPLSLSELAASKVKELVEQQDSPDLALRVYVSGGGCSGLQYGMALDETIEPDDQVFETQGVKVVVDSMSLRYISGATVDYIENGLTGGFKVNNPNATGGCGCGSSFSTEDGAAPASGGGCGSGCGCK